MLISFLNDVNIQLILEFKISFGKYKFSSVNPFGGGHPIFIQGVLIKKYFKGFLGKAGSKKFLNYKLQPIST